MNLNKGQLKRELTACKGRVAMSKSKRSEFKKNQVIILHNYISNQSCLIQDHSTLVLRKVTSPLQTTVLSLDNKDLQIGRDTMNE